MENRRVIYQTGNEKASQITDCERKTAIYLLNDFTVKEVMELCFVSFGGLQSQTGRIRLKMNTATIYAALGRMIALEIIKKDELFNCLPNPWCQYMDIHNYYFEKLEIFLFKIDYSYIKFII